MYKGFDEKFVIIAHRGASTYEPENTMSSFKKAIELGADMVEFDVRLSLDQKLIVIHDRTLSRTTDGSGLVREKSLDDLKKLNAGNNEKIPTFEELIKFGKDKTKFVIELKEENTEDGVIDLVNKYNLINDVFIVSFKKKLLKRIKALEPKLITGLIKFFPTNIISDGIECGANVIAVHKYFINQGIVKNLHKNNLFVIAWIVDDLKRCKKLMKIGVNGIVTNKPDLLNL